MPATLLEFARINDDAARTTKKLQKQKILADYLRWLDEDELRLAVRYAGGRAFAATDERVLGASGAIVSDAVLSILNVDPNEFWSQVVKKGEIGEALSDLWAGANRPLAGSPAQQAPLHLIDLARAFDELSSIGNQQRKREIVRDVFMRCMEPREAAYVAKIIFSDMRTGVREGVLHDAIAQAFSRAGESVRRAQLLVGDLGEVAVLAKHERLHEAKFQLFHPIQFMLATPQETAEVASATMAGKAFFAEDKLDGIRAQVHKQGEGPVAHIAIYSRTMDRIDESFPDVVESIRQIPGEFLLDGEIVPFRDGVVLPFAHIQKRLGRKVLTAKIIRDNPATFIAFDILFKNGALLMERPLRERRIALERLNPTAGASEVNPKAESRNLKQIENPKSETQNAGMVLITRVKEVSGADEIDRAFCMARDCRNEGLVLKDPESLYTPGRRGRAWLKLKTHLPTLDCVVTAAEYGHGKRRGVLSDYTFAVWDRQPGEPDAQLVNIGKAYSGVTDEEIAQLTKVFFDLSIAQRGHVHLVQPKIVLEIACDQIQRSTRHASGYALRFPRIKRIRWDKRPEDADRLSSVIDIYDSAANTARGGGEPVFPPPPEPTLFDGID